MGSGKYEEVGSASDVSQINPYTGQAWSAIQGVGGQFAGATPDAAIANLVGRVPQLQGLISGIMGPYAQLAYGQASMEGEQAARQIAQQFATENALNSGAYESAVSRGVALPFAQAATNIAGMQANLGGGLAQNYLGLAGQRMGTLGSIYGQGLGTFGAPEWYEPTYAYQPGFWDYAAPIAGAVGGAALGGLTGGLGGAAGMAGGLPAAANYYPTTQTDFWMRAGR